MTITGYAGAYYVFPGVFAPLVAWNNMVYGKLPGLFAAILTGKLVAVKNLKAGQLSLRSGTFNQISQFDY